MQIEDFTSMIVDEALADIVLVKKAEMEEWKKKQEQLRIEMEETSNRVESTISDVKNSFKKQMTDQEIAHKKEKKNLEERFRSLMSEKSVQEHEYSQNIKRLELSQIETIEELKSIFDKKSAIDNANYLTLEQKKTEMEQQYIKNIKEMEDNNHKMIEELEANYKSHIDKIMEEFEDSKKTADGLKTMYEEKLTQQEDEHEQEIAELKAAFEKEKDMLNDII